MNTKTMRDGNTINFDALNADTRKFAYSLISEGGKGVQAMQLPGSYARMIFHGERDMRVWVKELRDLGANISMITGTRQRTMYVWKNRPYTRRELEAMNA